MKLPNYLSSLGLVVFSTAAALTLKAPAHALVIDFEDFSPPTSGLLQPGSSFTSKGFTFATDTFDDTARLSIVDNANTFIPNTGSNTLQSSGFLLNSNFTLTSNDGSSFNLLSLLALEGYNLNSGSFGRSATRIELLGTFAGGGTISESLNLDLIAAENDVLDSQLFNLAGFNNLSSVKFTGFDALSGDVHAFAVDDLNISFDAAPIPTPVILPGILTLFGSVVRKKRIGENETLETV